MNPRRVEDYLELEATADHLEVMEWLGALFAHAYHLPAPASLVRHVVYIAAMHGTKAYLEYKNAIIAFIGPERDRRVLFIWVCEAASSERAVQFHASTCVALAHHGLVYFLLRFPSSGRVLKSFGLGSQSSTPSLYARPIIKPFRRDHAIGVSELDPLLR